MIFESVGSFRLLLYVVLNLTKSCSKEIPESFRMGNGDDGEGKDDNDVSTGFIRITIGLMIWKGSLPEHNSLDMCVSCHCTLKLTMYLHQFDFQSALFCDRSKGILQTIVIVDFELGAVILLDDYVIILGIDCIQLRRNRLACSMNGLTELITFE